MLDSVSEILRLQSDGEASAVDIATAALDRIEEADGVINAFTHLNRESTLAAAADVDRRRTAGQPIGPLAGVPVAVKDVLCTRDMPTTCSSKMLRNFHPPYDSGEVEKLRAAEAVIVGKTNMDEFAMGASLVAPGQAATTTAAAAAVQRPASRQAWYQSVWGPIPADRFGNPQQCAGSPV